MTTVNHEGASESILVVRFEGLTVRVADVARSIEFYGLSKGPGADYIKGQIEHIDGIPLEDNSTNGGVAEPGLTQENCKEWGYTDFSGAT